MEKRDIPLSERNSSDTVGRRGASRDDLPGASLEWEQWLDCITDILFIADSEGRIVRANKAMAEAFGTTVEELAGRDCREVLYGDDPPPEEPVCRAVLKSGGCVRRELLLPGHEGVYQSSAYGLERSDGSVGGVLVWIKDITKRKKTEEQLRRSETELQEYINGMATLSARLAPDGAILTVSKAAVEITGMTLDDLQGMPFWDAPWWSYDKDVQAMIREDVGRAASGTPVARDVKIRAGEDRYIYINFGLTPVFARDESIKFLVAEGRDITERKKTENELRARTELLGAVLSNVTESMSIENENYDIEYMNRAGIEQYGDGVGRKCYEHYMSRAEPCEMPCPIRELLLKNAPSPIHFSRVMPDGSETEVVSSVITRPDGGRAVLSAGRDVTERKRLEEQLRQAQKMETVGTLAGGVAHEFNNLHCGILGYLDIILRREKLSDSVREKLERVHLATMRAADVTRNLLVFSRKQPTSKRPACLDEVVRETLKIVQAEFETSGIRVRANLKAAEEFLMDRGQIGQVLMNLLVNARDSMTDSDHKELSITTTLDRRRATLKVSDTGCGIPKSILTRIFEPFYTTKGPLGGLGGKTAGSIPGTGLGLSVCHGIVKDHGGAISVESEQGVGTTFTVTMPRIQAPPVAERTPRHVRVAGGERVVLVDDDEMIRDMILELLKAEGYHALGFREGKKALDHIRRNKTDAVIVDLQMPGVSGVEFLRRINEIPRKDRPTVIVITGKATDPDVEGYSELHVFDTIRKPFMPSDLLERLYAALHERRLETKPEG